jgi:hypothetical protein
MFGFHRQAQSTDRASRPTSVKFRLEALESRDVPALFANADLYAGETGRVLTVTPDEGILVNDFSDTFPGFVLSAQLVAGPNYVGNNRPFPANSLKVDADGGFRLIIPDADDIPLGATQAFFTYQATNTAGEVSNVATVTINLNIGATRLIATGADAPGGPHVKVFESGSGIQRFNFFPFESTFTGGVRVAVGDLNNDGIDDIATIPGNGGAVRVRVFSGRDGGTLEDFFAFDPAFRGGGYVAIGDFNGDGLNDIIVGAGQGGGPRVQVFARDPLDQNLNGQTLETLADFFAFDANDRFGVRVAAGDLEDLDRDFIVTAPGSGGGPLVRVFDGQQVVTGIVAFPVREFFATDPSNRDGVWIATGNLRGDGQFDIVTGNGAGNGIVRVFDGRNSGLIREIRVPVDETPSSGGVQSGPSIFSLQSPQSGSLLNPSLAPSSLVPNAFPFVTPNNPLTGTVQGGVRVATTDYDGDGLDDIVTANGSGQPPRVRIFKATDQSEIINLLAYSATFLGGVNVGAN